MMLLAKIYLYHLWFRLIWLKDKLFASSLEQQSLDKAGLLFDRYSVVAAEQSQRQRMRVHESRVFSQNGEDGLLLYIFSLIGVTNRTLVEFGIETGRECNAANLLINFGWNGLMMDGSAAYVDSANVYYQGLDSGNADRIKIIQCFVTRDNINATIAEAGITGEIDLLSVDIDGNDYWVWQAIDVINPRVVVVEYNASFGAERSLTVCYDPAFTRFDKHKSGWYYGVSLMALSKLGEEKGYALVCADSRGCNAFFVREDLLTADLQKVTAQQAYYEQPKRARIAQLEQQFALIEHLPFEQI